MNDAVAYGGKIIATAQMPKNFIFLSAFAREMGQ